jgi:hypothetical protein
MSNELTERDEQVRRTDTDDNDEMDRAAAEAALKKAQQAQTAYWLALQDLEEAVGYPVDGTQDLCDATVESLLVEQE